MTMASCRVLAIPVCVGLVLAGCAGDDGSAPAADAPSTITDAPTPDTTPRDDHTPDPTPTTEPTPTPDPTAALEAEITEFFEEYIDVVNRSWTSREALDRRREMFSDSCQACLVGYEFAQRVHDESLSYDGEEADLIDVLLVEFDAGSAIFLTSADYPEGSLVSADGDVAVSFDPARGRQTLYQVNRKAEGGFVIVFSEAL